MQPITATARYARAIRSLSDLLTRLRLDFAFLGSVARSVYLGGRVDGGSIDVVALMSPEQKNQVAMMANNRGFRVDREELEATEELDMIPFALVDAEGDVRIHVLVASNALYGRMVAEGVPAPFEETTLKVPRVEDFALLLQLSSDVTALTQVIASDAFDRAAYNQKLASIGLRELVIPE